TGMVTRPNVSVAVRSGRGGMMPPFPPSGNATGVPAYRGGRAASRSVSETGTRRRTTCRFGVAVARGEGHGIRGRAPLWLARGTLPIREASFFAMTGAQSAGDDVEGMRLAHASDDRDRDLAVTRPAVGQGLDRRRPRRPASGTRPPSLRDGACRSDTR